MNTRIPPGLGVRREASLGTRHAALDSHGGVRPAAYSLIEMIAVVAVIAILASLLFPVAIKRIDIRTRNEELANLNAMSNALAMVAVRSNSIPCETNWAQTVADWSALSVSGVQTNSRGYHRAYFMRSGSGIAIPYSQLLDGAQNYPASRALILSVLGGDEISDANCAKPGGGFISTTEFDELWKLADGTRPTSEESGLFKNWNGRGDDYLVQRIDYASLFHRLVLINREYASNGVPQFSINGVVTNLYNAFPANNPGWDRYYLDGTIIGLGSPYGTNMARYTLKRDISFVYELGKWRCKIRGVREETSLASDFAKNAAQFMGADWNDDKLVKGANQQGIVTGMYTFMLTYTFWANRTPLHFPWRTATTIIQVPEYELLADLGDPNGRLDVYSQNLLQ